MHKKKIISVIKKYYEYFATKIAILKEQNCFCFSGTKVKYIFKQNKESSVLLIVLSSCTRKGIKARYNYMKTLKNIPYNKLFILDDYAADHRGSFYLGKNLDFSEEAATNELIRKIKNENQIDLLVFCGSSKGGYAALNFGLEYDNAFIIAGGPQYYLGDYLINSENLDAYRHIVGNCETEETKEFLNQRLKKKIENKDRVANQKLFLHYSNQEHTYEEHIKYLIHDLEARGQSITTDVASYTNHSDISYYFPTFLINTIQTQLNRQ